MLNLKRLHKNIPQVVFNLVQAVITICFWGRGTGKTEGPGGDFTLTNVLTMPRSLGGIVSISYDKLVRFILPKLIKSWEKMGYYQDVHFWIGKYAPDHLNRPKPYLAPTETKYFIHWWNGAGIQLLSLDRMGLTNSADLDWIYADEAKLFDHDHFVEVMHTNRGNSEHFGHLPNHHSLLITTDRPADAKGQWLYDIADKHDPERVNMIIRLQQHIFDLKSTLSKARSERRIHKIQKSIREFEGYIKELRTGVDGLDPLVFCSEASTLDNVHALGVETIKKLKRTLSPTVYRISVLNERITEVEDGFYASLSDRKHGYLAFNPESISLADINFKKNVEPACTWYTDRDPLEPLDIAMDHNAKINNIMTGQAIGKEYRFIHSHYTKSKYQNMIHEWCAFFKDHPTKIVNYYYDHTMVAGRDGHDLTISEEITELLTSLGWSVNRRYIGQQPSHKLRFLFWEKWLAGDADLPLFRFNRTTCEYWYERAKQTGTLITSKGTGKDKRDEKKPNFPQELAPHITDAGDTLAIGAVLARSSKHGEFTELSIH